MQHFEKDLAVVEIIGKSKRVERVYFPVDRSQLALWCSRELQETKAAFLQTVERENVKLKHAQFVDFCEDTIFAMRQTTRLLGTPKFVLYSSPRFVNVYVCVCVNVCLSTSLFLCLIVRALICVRVLMYLLSVV